MTETEWFACADPGNMLAFLHGKVSARKLYLFAAACKREGDWERLPPEWRRSAELEELYADQQVTLDELIASRRYQSGPEDEDIAPNPFPLAQCEAYDLAKDAGEWAIYDALQGGKDPGEEEDFFDAGYQAAEAKQCRLIRDLVGNPFRPVAVEPAWQTPVAVALARAIYDERRFGDLPVLADALEEAGCNNEVILSHCRQPGLHTRGCWALDLVLGKT